MPGLQSFCVCTAFALAAIYILQVTWYTACMVIDEKRIIAGRNCLVPCIVNSSQPCPSLQATKTKLNVSVPLIDIFDSTFFKGVVILLSCLLLAFGIIGCINIEVKFDWLQLLPKDSYLRQLKRAAEVLYPNDGWHGEVFTGKLNSTDLQNVENLTARLHKLKNLGETIKGNIIVATYFLADKKGIRMKSYAC